MSKEASERASELSVYSSSVKGPPAPCRAAPPGDGSRVGRPKDVLLSTERRHPTKDLLTDKNFPRSVVRTLPPSVRPSQDDGVVFQASETRSLDPGRDVPTFRITAPAHTSSKRRRKSERSRTEKMLSLLFSPLTFRQDTRDGGRGNTQALGVRMRFKHTGLRYSRLMEKYSNETVSFRVSGANMTSTGKPERPRPLLQNCDGEPSAAAFSFREQKH